MEQQEKNWMIYGANGYTGRLVAEHAKSLGLKPVLAGRNAAELRELAAQLDLPWRAFALHSIDLEGVGLVLNCAGPFSSTSEPMLSACLRAKAHYLDITGEIEVFERTFARNEQARLCGSVVIPGVGFDVVPTDCLALSLAEGLPGATGLELAIDPGGGSVSRGTLKTMVENLHKPGCVRRDGKLTPVPTAYATRTVEFPHAKRSVSSIPWGDVSTAYHSTGIPNITVYVSTRPWVTKALRLARPAMKLTALPVVQNFLKAQITKRVSGPDEKTRQTARCRIWGEATRIDGKKFSRSLEIPEGYRFTALASVRAVQKVLAGEVGPGVWTPSRAFGSAFVTELPETKMFH